MRALPVPFLKSDDFRSRLRPLADRTPLALVKHRGKREALFRQGDPASHVFRITQGAVALAQFLEDGRRQLVDLLLTGDICGLSSDGVYTSTGVALVPTSFEALSLSEVERHPGLGAQFVRQLQAQLCAAHDHVLAVGRMAAVERVCSLLLHLKRLEPTEAGPPGLKPGSISIHIPLTRGEMGDYLGLSLETVCRVMSELERRGLIEIGRRHGDVVIMDLARMKRLIS